MPLLSICMPTKRDFKASKRSIEQALAFAEARDALVVISDNSGDAEKQAYWENRSPRIRYHVSRAPSAFDNFLEAASVADTPFVLTLGDDDGITTDPSARAIDLATLSPDFMGVRPRTLVEVTGYGVLREKTFAIDAPTPAGRIREYSEKAAGDNSGFYSIFRREPYVDLLRLFIEQHPTRGNYIDWALSLALFAYGRMAYDPGVVFHYNADQWASQENLESKNAEIFANAGLPAHTTIYQPLLMALDVLVFVARPGTPLSREEALDAVSVAAGDLMNAFINQVIREPSGFSSRTVYLAQLAQQEMEAFARFQLGVLMVDELRPGLKDSYVAFFRHAMGMS